MNFHRPEREASLEPRDGSSADRWARRGAWLAVVSVALALVWVGLTLFRPAPAEAANKSSLELPTAVADAPSARSTR